MKHGAAGGAVTLRLLDAADGLAIQVEDRGPGIAEADRAVAMKRFGRLDSARTTPGRRSRCGWHGPRAGLSTAALGCTQVRQAQQHHQHRRHRRHVPIAGGTHAMAGLR